jgi:hypothetical protein
LLLGRQQTIPFVIQTQKPPGSMGIKGQRIEDIFFESPSLGSLR